jgi:hypothetical protein
MGSTEGLVAGSPLHKLSWLSSQAWPIVPPPTHFSADRGIREGSPLLWLQNFENHQ